MCDVTIEVLKGPKCGRCWRFVKEVFEKVVGQPPICRRCCIVLYDIEHGRVGTLYPEDWE